MPEPTTTELNTRINEQNARINELERLLVAATIRMDLMELVQEMNNSQGIREKSAWKYAEEAIAAEFGISVCEFIRKPRGRGRPKGNVLPLYRQAQFTLFSFLVHVLGTTTNEVRIKYGSFVASHQHSWGELFNVVHYPREFMLNLSDPKQRAEKVYQWDTYAARYLGAYVRWKTMMLSDGVWSAEYDVESLTELTT